MEELIDDLNTCEDEKYLPSVETSSLKQEGWRLRQLIDGYIRYLRQQKTDSSAVAEKADNYDAAAEIEHDSRFSI